MKLQLLVPIHTYPDSSSSKLIRHVTAVAHHLDAEVHALVLIADFPRVSSPLGNLIMDVPAMVGSVKAECRASGAARVKELAADLKLLGVPFRSTEVDCYPASFGEIVARHAPYYDLVLTGIATGGSASRGVAEAAIFGSGRPILVVREDMPDVSFRHVMIAWDGSAVAARAVADSRAFLQRARAVTIVSAVDEKVMADKNPGDRLAQYLAKHDIQAAVAQLRGDDRPIARVLQDYGEEIGADMLVMGGFGHSRVRDFVLGGATNGILSDPRIFTLMSH